MTGPDRPGDVSIGGREIRPPELRNESRERCHISLLQEPEPNDINPKDKG